MSDYYEKEEVLTGGNVSAVYRKGSTVRRDVKPNSFQIHKVLTHLEKKNFNFAPKFLGVDEKNREVLSFIEGEAGNYPLKAYMWSDETLKDIAKMLRLYHDAEKDANRIKQRINLFFEAYDVPGIEKDYLEMVVLRLEGLCAYMKRRAGAGDIAFQQMVDHGHFDHYQEDIVFLRKHGKEWL
ncbi:hypothetical protein LZP85_08665 [Priestia flexa]|jgi:hypothetical protein|uniref:Aminoglycoside phosphotransferase domain-containing protein n=1 Tax=Priestia flexa TaxID=86664 RepID=A0A8I1MEA9_9BACI|nr:hypothetical protein [Priestia flexa]MBN8251261.1 hypothetical protein [Priestia flexa]MBN8434476.1 hypothetical protein [Priestia flexa]MCA0966738.1 hypothetical protein [Priestia flexa]UIR31831.1 hypothetical protein LZP85_08665 [Priestia flexa]UZW65428.1 hypothetical protein OC195_15005 [Priestia flexa]